MEVINKRTISPDGTIFYDYDYAKEIYSGIAHKKFILSEIILMLLYSQSEKPISGRVSFMKQVFLLIEEVIGKEETPDSKFIPHRFGMYSFSVTNTIENLEYLGLIEKNGRRNTKLEKFYLTEKGAKQIADIYESLPLGLQEKISQKRKSWDQWGYKGIIKYVYQKYWTYVEKSEIKDKYKAIKWGRGTG